MKTKLIAFLVLFFAFEGCDFIGKDNGNHNMEISFRQDKTLRLVFVRARDLLRGEAKHKREDGTEASAIMYRLYTGEAYYSIKLGQIRFLKDGIVQVSKPSVQPSDLRVTDPEVVHYEQKGMSKRVKDKMTDEWRTVAEEQFRKFVEQKKYRDLALEQAEEVLKDMLGKDIKIVFEDNTEQKQEKLK